jgi:hypothetical protein
MLLHKVIGLVLVVLAVCDGDFMVKVVLLLLVLVDKGVVAWRATVVCESETKVYSWCVVKCRDVHTEQKGLEMPVFCASQSSVNKLD